MNSVIIKRDLQLSFKVLDDNKHKYEIRKIADNKSPNRSCVEIKVKNRFSLSTGEIPIIPGKKYKLSLTLKNHDANPVLLYYFSRKPKTLTRNYTLAGKNGNPPSSETQKVISDWKTFEEYFDTRENEDSLMIRLFSDSGTFSIATISIEDIS
jgi:hypothetical protein